MGTQLVGGPSVARELSLRWLIFLSGCNHAMGDSQADQTENTYPDPLRRHVEQVGT